MGLGINLYHWLSVAMAANRVTDAGFEAVLMETPQVKAALMPMPITTGRWNAVGIARLSQMG